MIRRQGALQHFPIPLHLLLRVDYTFDAIEIERISTCLFPTSKLTNVHEIYACMCISLRNETIALQAYNRCNKN